MFSNSLGGPDQTICLIRGSGDREWHPGGTSVNIRARES